MMILELPPSVLATLATLETSLTEMRAELKEMRAEWATSPAVAATSRRQYTVEEVAKTLSKTSYTVREWCRHGQVNATKRAERRGSAALWSISADEVERIKNDGLLPLDPSRNHA